MEFNMNDLKVTIDECGSVTIKDKENEIFLGESSGRRFKTVFRAMNVGRKLSRLNSVVSEDSD